MVASPEQLRMHSPPGTYRTCVTCQRRTHCDEMLDEYECIRCHTEYIEKQRRRKLTQEVMQQKQALGKAVNSMAREIGKGRYVPNEPHLVYAALMERMGGVEGFADVVVAQFKEQCEKPAEEKSGKVIVDFIKMFLTLGIESKKNLPPPPAFDNMTDEELADYLLQAAQRNLQEIREQERQAELPPALPEIPEEGRDVVLDLVTAASQREGNNA